MEILIRPIISEKLTRLGEKLNRYGFVVDKRANKLQIKTAVEKMYGVNVQNVNTMIIPGKKKTRMTKTAMTSGMKSSYKKAIVTLNTGETIDFYSYV